MSTRLLIVLGCAWLIAAASGPVPQISNHPIRPAVQHSKPADKEWWYRPHKDHTPSGAPNDVDFNKYNVRYLGDTSRKVVYLTFDAGYETGFLPSILDTLKANGVHASFFITRYYMKEAPQTVKRMLVEGHAIGNHTATHPAHLLKLPDARIQSEITDAAAYYKQLTGQEMMHLWRPPMGEYDDRMFKLAAGLGWKTVFWSMAYVDYEKQRGNKYAEQYVEKYYHPGAIILLHPFQSNAVALGGIIKELKAAGYEFGRISDLP